MECGRHPTPCSSTQTLTIVPWNVGRRPTSCSSTHIRDRTGCRVHTGDVAEKRHEILNWRLHNIEDKSRTDRKGGGAVFIDENISYERALNIPHEIEGVSFKIRTIKQEINITLLYLPPAEHIDFGIIKPILSSKNRIICVDMNVKNTLWGATKNDHRGKQLGGAVDDLDLTVLNPGRGTRLNTDGVTHPSWCRPHQRQLLVKMRLEDHRRWWVGKWPPHNPRHLQRNKARKRHTQPRSLLTLPVPKNFTTQYGQEGGKITPPTSKSLWLRWFWRFSDETLGASRRINYPSLGCKICLKFYGTPMTSSMTSKASYFKAWFLILVVVVLDSRVMNVFLFHRFFRSKSHSNYCHSSGLHAWPWNWRSRYGLRDFIVSACIYPITMIIMLFRCGKQTADKQVTRSIQYWINQWGFQKSQTLLVNHQVSSPLVSSQWTTLTLHITTSGEFPCFFLSSKDCCPQRVDLSKITR